MTFKEDVIAFGMLAVAVVGVAWWAKNKIADAIPETVKEGAEATGLIIGQAVKNVIKPLESFGITQPNNGAWQVGAPTGTSNDPVTNSDYGINFNMF